MAAIEMMIGGAVVNALAFIGGNYRFSMLGGKSGETEKERKRHDLAIRALQRTEIEYQHKRQLRLDYLNQQLRAEQHSMQVFEDDDATACEYWLVTGDQEKLDKVPDAGEEPTFNEYYEPSALQKEYELLFMAGWFALTGWAALSFCKSCNHYHYPFWALTTHTVRNVIRQPPLYYLNVGPARGFVREKLLVVIHGTQLPPHGIMSKG